MGSTFRVIINTHNPLRLTLGRSFYKYEQWRAFVALQSLSPKPPSLSDILVPKELCVVPTMGNFPPSRSMDPGVGQTLNKAVHQVGRGLGSPLQQ